MLFSEGFISARVLAKKMTVLYHLAQEQLSKQTHYDFGLRALKAVLVMAGSLKRESPEYTEELVLMRALRDMNLPKFVVDDVELFLGLISDLFPGMDCPRVTRKDLKTAVIEELEKDGYGFRHNDPDGFAEQVNKIIQLYEVMQTRHTTMVVGPTGGGKSVVIQTLAKAEKRARGVTVKLLVLNPKSLTVPELYGVLDPTTRDWTDGLLSKLFVEANEPLKPDQPEARYIVFDGDVDALWVENMNSVMDDNKLLTQPNGKRILLEDHVKLLFEVADLQYASPATVSRCGMVYVDPRNLGYAPYFWRWLAQRTNGDERLAELLQSLYDRYIDQCVNACLYGTDEKAKPLVGGVMETIIPVTALGMVKQFCTLLSSLLTDMDKASEAAAAAPAKADGKADGTGATGEAGADGKTAEEKAVLEGLEGGLLDDGLSALTRLAAAQQDSKRGGPQGDLLGNAANNTANADADEEGRGGEGEGGEHKDQGPPRDQEVVESIFIFCLVWSIGGALKKDARFRFQNYVKTISNRTCVSTALKGHLPEESLYDFWFNLDPSFQRWQKWEAPKYVRPPEMVFARVLVPTVDTVRYTHFLGRYLDSKKPLLLVGESGTAKTVTVRHHLSNLDARKFVSLGINFSSRTQSVDVQTIIESNVDQRTGNIYGPTPGTQMVVFIDDLNMPRVDEYGTQQPIALLKFLIERDAMYERPSKNADQSERAVKKLFRDLLYMAAMAPPGGGRNAVDPRFISLFNVMGVPLPDDDALLLIYSSIIHSHMEHYSFHEDIHDTANKLTPLTIKLYHDLCTKLLPTPDRFHYVFNLRDLSRVYEGLLRSRPDKFDTPSSFVRLWRNEVLRVFHDRLITEADKKLVRDDLVAQLIHDNFPNETKHALADPILFGDYRQINSEVDSEVRMYEDLGEYSTIKGIFNEVLANYNEEQDKNLNLVLFQDALEHVTRIHRIIRMPRGNALLVGVGGSGKQSLAKLACYASGYRVYQISLQRVYGEDQFKEDLKQLYHVLGADKGGSPVVFLFTDAHVKHESFLEMINNMLTSGMVPALFTEEERLPLIDSVREECRAKGIMINRESCWNFFVNKCVDNLHVVLSMSPGETLRRRCRNFPGLVNNTVIDWFFPWPQAALHAVAEHFLANEEHISDAHRPHIVNHMVLVHDSVGRYSHEFEQELRRPNHVTPKNYLDYINNYRKQLTSNRDRNKQQYERLEGGLKKLVDANEAVEAYGEELNERKKIVDAKAKEVQQMIANIKERQAEVERKQKVAQEKETKLRDDSVHIKYEAEQADKALAEAEPLLRKAAEALNVLEKKDIAEVKGMPNPPVGVLAVCQCVLELKPTGTEKPEEGWKAAKVMMNDANFLKNLQKYKRDNISESQIKRVNKILRRKPNDPKQKLNYENLIRISRAAAGLYLWVDAVVKYNKVSRQVLPRREKVLEMQRVMDRSQRELKQIEEELTFLQNQIAEHNRRYVEKSDELKDLEQKAEQMEKHLSAASQLISGLESEKLRWGHEKDRLAITKARLVGDCLLAAAFLSYAGAFTFEYRQRMIFQDWAKDVGDRGIPLTNGFKLEDLLSSPVEISRWTQEGLPPDQLSIQNGILTTRASRWPLCIDPQMQAVKWIKSKESKTQGSVMDREKQARFLEKKQREKKREQDRAIKRLDEEKERKAAEKQARDKRDRDNKKGKKDDSKDEKRGGAAAGGEDAGDDEATAMGWESGTLGEGHELKAWTFNDDFMRPLEWAISLGQPFLFEGVVEELDPILDPILEKNLITTAQGTRAISLGDNHNIDWNDNFRLYFITKLSNPKFSPEIAGKTMIINYSVTMQGLEDQLLTVVLGKERDDLRGAREELIQTIAQNNIALAGLEEDILRELNFATGNILDNNVLIETLKNAKSKSASIQDQQVESRETQKEIERVTDNYRPAATRGAILFFAMSGLSAISSMYEFALASYLEVFQRALDVAQLGRDASSVSKRVNNIIEELTRNVYEYVCTGIFERHKTMFSLQMTTMIMDGAGKLNREELDFFLKGNVALSDAEKPRPAEWIPEGGWRDLQRLVQVGTSTPGRIDPSKIGTDDASTTSSIAATPSASSPTGAEKKDDEKKGEAAKKEEKKAPVAVAGKKGKFSNLVIDIVEHIGKWKDWFDDEHPEMVAMPCGYSTALNSFQQLLILRCLRPDRVYNAVQRFIVEQMGESFVTPPTLFLSNIFKQSSPTSPVVFILSPGADPRNDLEELAKQHNMFPQFFKPLALGQGQSKEAEKLVINGYSRGHWVLLQNCHLLTSWLKTLEKLLLALPATGKMPHKDFRLWLTTDPTPEFPLGILQRALKVVTEPPDKLKQNMKATYSKLREADLEECAHTAYRPLVYVLSFFHAVVQERRKYGKLGWNVSYDFNDSDFNVSRRLLAMYLTKAHVNKDEMIPWNSLRYLIGEAMYGGRVTDSYDRRILITYLEEYMGDFLFDDCQPFFFAESDATPDGDSKSLAGLKYKYTVPTGPGTLESFSRSVNDFPRDQSPTVFGLHSNAEIRYNTDSVKSIWRNLIDLQPRGKVVGGATSREEYIKTMAARLAGQVPGPEDLIVIKRELIKKNQGHRERALARLKRETRAAQLAAQAAESKRGGSAAASVAKKASTTGEGKEEKATVVTPVPIDLDDTELDEEKDEDRTDGMDDSFAATGAGNAAAEAEAAKRLSQLPPTTTVLMQELERWNKLVIKMKDSLTELQKAMHGYVAMSNELEDLAAALFDGRLPQMWRRLAPHTQKGLGSWMVHFARRHDQYTRWIAEGRDPKVIWLSGLHVPESYLTALVQASCRRKKWPLDKSTLYTKVTTFVDEHQVKDKPVDGCYITGLYLEGAAWDHKNSCLRVQDPKVLVVELPILQVIPIESNKLKLQNTFKTPVYVTQNRRTAMGQGLVFEADLTTPVHPSHWILQGTALVLNTDV
jgi:MoxR-like ATPase